MIRFLIRRILTGALVLLLVTMVVFAIFYIGPGPKSVAHVLAGKQATPAEIAAEARRLHLNLPLYHQYWDFLVNILHGNLGYDFYHGEAVTTIIGQAFPITLSLALGAAVLWVTMGVLSGVVSAVRSRSFADRFLTIAALFFYSMPTFVLGLLLLFGLYYELTIHGVNFFPGGGYTPITTNPWLWFKGMILPWITLALVSAAPYTRLMRGALLDVLGEDYIRTARAKGLTERRVTYRHGVRAALTPIASQFGIDVGVLLGGAVITETVFSMPGLGYTAVQAINTQDLPVIIGIVLIAATAVVVANVVVDIVYATLDPRVRLH
jgi:peptide/nickel transport system permease protein